MALSSSLFAKPAPLAVRQARNRVAFHTRLDLVQLAKGPSIPRYWAGMRYTRLLGEDSSAPGTLSIESIAFSPVYETAADTLFLYAERRPRLIINATLSTAEGKKVSVVYDPVDILEQHLADTRLGTSSAGEAMSNNRTGLCLGASFCHRPGVASVEAGMG